MWPCARANPKRGDEMSDFSSGAAYLDGEYMPIAQARIPVTHFGYRRSDVTYDVVGVWQGSFFRLDDHIRRFRASMTRLRMQPPESDDDIRRIQFTVAHDPDAGDGCDFLAHQFEYGTAEVACDALVASGTGQMLHQEAGIQPMGT